MTPARRNETQAPFAVLQSGTGHGYSQFSQGSTDSGKTWTVEYDFTYNRKITGGRHAVLISQVNARKRLIRKKPTLGATFCLPRSRVLAPDCPGPGLI